MSPLFLSRNVEVVTARFSPCGSPSSARGQWAVCSGRTSDAVSRPFPSWNRFISAEIYLCHACSCQEMLRTETAGPGVQVGGRVQLTLLARGESNTAGG
jgi:hypothetical protein